MFALSDTDVAVIIILLVFVLIIIGGCKLHDKLKERKEEKERPERERRQKEEEAKRQRYLLELFFDEIFGVSLSRANESAIQDEVVRIVNLCAYQTAVACVNQDKAGRGEDSTPYFVGYEFGQRHEYSYSSDTYTDKYWLCHESFCLNFSWDKLVSSRKSTWAALRDTALYGIPELKDRLPHFSEFEPLKSYNEEHLLRKGRC